MRDDYITADINTTLTKEMMGWSFMGYEAPHGIRADKCHVIALIIEVNGVKYKRSVKIVEADAHPSREIRDEVEEGLHPPCFVDDIGGMR